MCKTPLGKWCFHGTETSKPEVKQSTAAALRSPSLNSRLSSHLRHRLQSKAEATKVNCSRESKSLNMRQMKHEKRSSEPNNYSPLQENPLKKNKAIYNSAAEGSRHESMENNPPWKAILKFLDWGRKVEEEWGGKKGWVKEKNSKCKLVSFISGLIAKDARKWLNKSYCLSGHGATSSQARRESQMTEMAYRKIMEKVKWIVKKIFPSDHIQNTVHSSPLCISVTGFTNNKYNWGVCLLWYFVTK